MENKSTFPTPEILAEETDEFTTTSGDQEIGSDEGIVKNIDELKELIDANHPDIVPEDLL